MLRRLLVLVEKPGPEEPARCLLRETPITGAAESVDAEDRAVNTNFDRLYSADGGADRRKLKSYEDEDQSIQNKIQGLPDRPDLDANRGRKEFGAASGKEQSARDNRQYA